MKVFLSWSGTTSHKIAIALREWLPSVIQSVVPYVSSEDIDKGARWSTNIAKELEDSRYGVICVTKENIVAPWVNFEAGALSKIIDKSFVTPFLFDLKRSDVQGPLLQFQSTIFDKEEILKLLKSINNRSQEVERLKDDKLSKAFDVWWPQLNEVLKAIKTNDDDHPKQAAKGKDKTPEILEELLELARTQQRLISNPASLLPHDYLAFVLERTGFREGRVIADRELLHRIHRSILELEEFLIGYSKSHADISDAVALMAKIHDYFHSLPDWPGERMRAEPRRLRRTKADPS